MNDAEGINAAKMRRSIAALGDDMKSGRSARKIAFRPGCAQRTISDPHGHDDVAVLVVVRAEGAELAGGLGVFQFEAHVARADCFQEIEDVDGVEADSQAI